MGRGTFKLYGSIITLNQIIFEELQLSFPLPDCLQHADCYC